jgi:hypothetical protein
MQTCRGFSSRSLKEHGSARGNEKSCGSRREIRPGNRGTDSGAGPLIPCPPQGGKGSFHQFLWTGSHPSRNANQELRDEVCIERNHTESSQVRRGVSTRRTDAVAQRGPDYYCEPARARRPGGTTPPQGSCCTSGARKRPANSGSGRMWQSSQNLLIGADGKTVPPNCNAKVI